MGRASARVMLSSTPGGEPTAPGRGCQTCASARLCRLDCSFRRRVLQPGLFLELLLDIAAQSALHLRVIELALPLRDNDGRDAVADEIGKRARLRHETVDAENQREACNGDRR